jgi:hypothetical protein
VTHNRSASDPDQRIKPGDIVLFINSFVCLAEKSHARNSLEYGRALADVISTATLPKAVRFLRCFHLDADNPESIYSLRYARADVRSIHVVHAPPSSHLPLPRVVYVAVYSQCRRSTDADGGRGRTGARPRTHHHAGNWGVDGLGADAFHNKGVMVVRD